LRFAWVREFSRVCALGDLRAGLRVWLLTLEELMQRRNVLLAVVACLAIAACLAMNLGRPQAAYQREGSFQRWEYRLVSIAEGIREFNRLGADGWEICATMGAGQPQAVIVFKRPAP
jgi:hypothetical protein